MSRHFKSDYLRIKGEKQALYRSIFLTAIIVIVSSQVNVFFLLGVIIFSICYVKIKQGQLFGQSVRVTIEQFPKIHQLAETAANRLNMEVPKLFIVQDPYINAYAMGIWGQKSVVLHSKTVEAMNDDELCYILGHEFAHIKCGHTQWNVLANSSKSIRVPIVSDILGFIFLIWSRKAEFTADRGGVVANRNINASISALSKISIGEKLFEQLNLLRFIDQNKEINNSKISSLAEKLTTHPYTVKRIKSINEFYRVTFQTVRKGQEGQMGFSALPRSQNEIVCPRCNKQQNQSEECISCGIIFSKYQNDGSDLNYHKLREIMRLNNPKEFLSKTTMRIHSSVVVLYVLVTIFLCFQYSIDPISPFSYLIGTYLFSYLLAWILWKTIVQSKKAINIVF